MRKTPHLGIALWGTYPTPKLIEQVQIAEALGFESVWVIDSQLICREVFVTMAACLEKTSRIVMATGVTQPRTRHVSTTASALATLEELYPGRVMAGVGTGFSSVRTLGMAPAGSHELEQFVRSLRSLLHKEDVEFDNMVSGSIDWLEQACATQVHVAASGPKTTRLAASLGDGAILFQGVARDLLDRGIDWMTEGAEAIGRDLDALSVTCWAPLGVGDTSAAGHDDVRARVASSVMQANPDWFEGDEREALLRLRATYDSFKHASSRPDHSALISDRMVDRYAISGDAVEITEKLSTLLAHPRLERVVLTSQGGAVALHDALGILEKRVLPNLHITH